MPRSGLLLLALLVAGCQKSPVAVALTPVWTRLTKNIQAGFLQGQAKPEPKLSAMLARYAFTSLAAKSSRRYVSFPQQLSQDGLVSGGNIAGISFRS